jgi:DNA-binding transcriptional regulator YdaS (Cro superfamily)
MTKEEAITFYGSQEALAQAIGVKQPSVAGWGDEPPLQRQLDIELATGGKLRANLSDEMRAVLSGKAAA